MYGASDLRKGLRIEMDGDPYVITEFSFNKPGKGQAIYTCKLRNLLTGTTMTKQFRSNDKVGRPELQEKSLAYSYPEGDCYVFMDENYEQIPITADMLGDARYFLTEDMALDVLFYQGRPIDVTLPTFIDKPVVHTEPGVRGDTATNVMKPATVDGGYELEVPLFIEEGDLIRIDTRTGGYSERVAKGA